MKTPLTQEIDRLTEINAELVAALRAIVDLDNGANIDIWSIQGELDQARAALAKATPKPCTRACDSCACHEGVVS